MFTQGMKCPFVVASNKRRTIPFFDKCIPEPNSGCWIWLGSLSGYFGYGKLQIDNKSKLAHRYSWEIHNGHPGKMYVLHRCDNPYCVNPDHLFLGTHATNIADMVSKNRQRRGITANGVKLSEADILCIREDKRSIKLIGAHYGISEGHVYKIKAKERWKHL